MRLGMLIVATFVIPGIAFGQTPGVVVGWDARDGAILLGELNCLSCHDAGASKSILTKQAPILSDVGARVTPQYLRAFLNDMQAAKPGTAMPDVLHGIPDREKTIDALTHYLVSLGGPITQKGAGASQSQIERGAELFHSVGCVACHAPTAPPPKQKRDTAIVDDDDPKIVKAATKSATPLGDLAMKTTLPALAKFLEDPLASRPSGRMPKFPLEPGEAGALAAFLLRDQLSETEKAPGQGLLAGFYPGNHPVVPNFDKLKPAFESEVKAIDLTAFVNQATKKKAAGSFAVRWKGQIDIPEDGTYRFWTMSDDGSVMRIGGAIAVNNDGMHPPTEKEGTIALKKGRKQFEIGYIQGGGGAELEVYWQPPSATKKMPLPAGILLHDNASALVPKGFVGFELDATLVANGKQAFETLGCASCHQVTPKGGAPAKALVKLKATDAGCLAETPKQGVPKFAMNGGQRAALKKAVADLLGDAKELTAAARVDHTMNALSCYACHVRDGKGGPDAAKSNYFVYEKVVDLGDEGRLPPMLSGVGAKLTAKGFDDALFSGQRYRTAMATRMPNFGPANVGHLPKTFEEADQGQIPEYAPKFDKSMVTDGRTLTGRTALACINCHAWGPFRLPGAEGLDLLKVPGRIRPDWFHAWLRDPNKIRPGTRMPTAWPDNKSFYPKLQAGDVDRQMDAIWAYLKAGDKGGFPAGLAPVDTAMLVPFAEPIVFRTFLDKVGAHSILVGFPQRIHVVFDANRVRMVEGWSGDFISTKAAWEGRAGNYAPVPSDQVVVFPPGPVLAKLPSMTDPWPDDLPKKPFSSTRTPPGWRFLGYRYDAQRNPTFLYRFDEMNIEETPGIETTANGPHLVRRFRFFRTDEPGPILYFRVAVGKTIDFDKDTWTVDKQVRYRLPGLKGVEPQVRTIGGKQELIVPIALRQSTSGVEAGLTIEVAW